MKKTPIKFLFVSYEGISVDIAWKISKEGNEVQFYIEKKSEKEIGKGFVKKIKTWEDQVSWADIIVFDHVSYGKQAEKLRNQGKHVIGGSTYTDKLENDRTFGQEELKKHGIKIVPYMEFDDFDKGIEYVQKNPDRYVIKPSGEAQVYKQLLFIGNEENGSDVIRVLSAYKKTWGSDISSFQLQKKVSGVEITVGAFFNGKHFIRPTCVYFEYKKLFPGDIGINTHQMGMNMFWQEHVPLFENTLKKLEPSLQKSGYHGYMSLNFLVNKNGVFPLEFTSRFGHPTISMQSTGIKKPMGDFLLEVANGTLTSFKTQSGFFIGILIAVPPFPYEDKKAFKAFSEDAVIVFKNKEKTQGIHIQDTKLLNNEWLITGVTGIAALVTGNGNTVREAQKKTHSRIQNLMIANMYYRDDIGDRWFEDGDKLRAWGYI